MSTDDDGKDESYSFFKRLTHILEILNERMSYGDGIVTSYDVL